MEFSFLVLDAGYGLVVGFIVFLNDVTASNFNSFNQLRTLHFNIARTNFAQFVLLLVAC
jgi:hypothetical protein